MKKITVAVVLDDNEGMLLFGKRQSRDRVLVADFVDSAGNAPIYASEFSKVLFESYDNVKLCKNPFEEAPDGAVCFIENFLLTPYLDMIDTLVIYRWNRPYHSDVKFDVDVRKTGYKLKSVSEFQGSSHDKITKEIYTR